MVVKTKYLLIEGRKSVTSSLLSAVTTIMSPSRSRVMGVSGVSSKPLRLRSMCCSFNLKCDLICISQTSKMLATCLWEQRHYNIQTVQNICVPYRYTFKLGKSLSYLMSQILHQSDLVVRLEPVKKRAHWQQPILLLSHTQLLDYVQGVELTTVLETPDACLGRLQIPGELSSHSSVMHASIIALLQSQEKRRM